MLGRAGGSQSGPPARPRILLLIKGLGLGGAERLLVALTECRDRANFDYAVAYVLEEQDALVPAMRAAGVPVYPLGAHSSADLRWLRRLRKLLVNGRFDLVHSHLPYSASFARVVAATISSGRRPVLVYTEHSLWNRAAVLTRALNRLTVSADSGLFVVSPAARDALPRRLRAGAQVVVHGVDLAQSRPLVARRDELRKALVNELGLRDDDVIALSVSNFRAEKGHDVLVDAAGRVARSGVPVRFLLVGWGPLEDEVRAAVRAGGLDRSVTMLGRRDDTLRLMAASDLFVLPSRQEGMPVALMEALSVGLPVVATRIGGVGDIVTDHVEGLLVDVAAPDQLAGAIAALATDRGLRDGLRAGALARAGELDITAAARQIEARYLELLAERAARGGEPGGTVP